MDTGQCRSPGTVRRRSPGTVRRRSLGTVRRRSPGTVRRRSPGTVRRRSPDTELWRSQPPPRRSGGWEGSGTDVSLGDSIGEAVVGAAMGFIGRAIGRRVRRTVEERVLPAMAARQQEMVRQRVAIAERHPDLRACLNDNVVFLAAGTRVLPLASAMKVTTVEQADALVAQLRNG